MPKRRMFSKDVINLDSFMDMPLSARALYFHLGMEADDDGFLGNPKMVIRSVGCSQGDMEHLIERGFVFAFATGVIVITHWNQNNHVPKDRYHETEFLSEKARLQLVNNVYTQMDTNCIQPVHRMDTKCIQPVYNANCIYDVSEDDINSGENNENAAHNGMYTTCIQSVSRMDTESSLGQSRLGKYSLGQSSLGQTDDTRLEEIMQYFFQTFGKSATENFANTVRAAFTSGLTFGDVRQAIADTAGKQPRSPSAYATKLLQDYTQKGGAPMLSAENRGHHACDPIPQWEKDWLEEFHKMKCATAH